MDVVNTLDQIQLGSFSSDTDRYAAKEAARRLLARLETPFERSWNLSFESPVLIGGLQVFTDLGIWSKWAEVNKLNQGAAQSLDDLLKMCETPIEPNLLRKCALIPLAWLVCIC